VGVIMRAGGAGQEAERAICAAGVDSGAPLRYRGRDIGKGGSHEQRQQRIDDG